MKNFSKIVFLFFLCFLPKIIFSQPNISWQKCLGGTNSEQANSIKQTSDGGYIIAGITYSNDGDVVGNHGYYDTWIVKIDSLRSIQWQKCLGGTNNDHAMDIELTNDGGYIFIGTTESNNGDVSGNHSNGYDIWCVKLNNIGAIQWQKCLGGSLGELGNSIQQTSDGGYIIAGSSGSNNGDVSGNHGGADCWIVKINNLGNIQWQKCLGGADFDNASNIEQTQDGGFILAGTSYSNDGDVSGNHFGGNSDYWIVKMDSLGNIQWQKCLGGTDVDKTGASNNITPTTSVIQTIDGGFMVSGTVFSNDGDVIGNHGSYDIWCVKLNNIGVIQWQKSLGGSYTDEGHSIQQTTDGGYIITGYSTSIDGDVIGNHGSDMWCVKLNNNGLIQWQKCLGGTFGEKGISMKQTTDGGYLIAGASSSNDGDVSGNHGNLSAFSDCWIVKLNNQSVGIEDKDINNHVEVYPNPTDNFIYIKTNHSNIKDASIIITDIFGRKLKNIMFNADESKIDISYLEKGIYFFHIENYETKTMKIIKN